MTVKLTKNQTSYIRPIHHIPADSPPFTRSLPRPVCRQGSRLSRYGFRTETTGEVTVRLSSLHQSQSWAVRPPGPSAAGGGGVGAVLEAFRRARLRMLRARQQFEESVVGAERDGRGAAEAAVSVG